MYEEPKMEKITVNLPPVDLGKIDILIESGIYPSRTEFIRSVIRKGIEANNDIIEMKMKQSRVSFDDNVVVDKEKQMRIFGVGVFTLSKDYFEKAIKANKTIRIHILGALMLADNITPEMVTKTIERIKVYGVIRASSEVKEALKKIA